MAEEKKTHGHRWQLKVSGLIHWKLSRKPLIQSPSSIILCFSFSHPHLSSVTPLFLKTFSGSPFHVLFIIKPLLFSSLFHIVNMFVPLSGLDANRCANVNQRRLLKIMYAQQTLLSLYKPRVPEEDCAVIKQRKVPVLFSLHLFISLCFHTRGRERK